MSSKNPELQNWADLSERSWPTLLVGNGVSINLWTGFKYSSLYDQADLPISIKTIFARLGTTNFEIVLECLHHGHIVNAALGEQGD